MKELAKAILRRTPYRVVRDYGMNRFQAIDICLKNLRHAGFEPSMIVDAGAHLGQFSLTAATIFSCDRFHLIEPQPSCAPTLRAICTSRGWHFHEVALGTGAYQDLFLTRADLPNTGVHVVESKQPDPAQTISARASSLDQVLNGEVRENDRLLLKLDLQGYELNALRGGARTLQYVEVVLTEVSFFAQAYEPTILQLMQFLDEHDFELFDIAALAARRRDNRAHQGDFLFARRDSRLLADTRWN